MRANTFTWALLLLLTTGSYFLGGAGNGRGLAGFVLVAAGLKCAGLGWQFMDLRWAHGFWRVALLGLLAGFLAAVALLRARA